MSHILWFDLFVTDARRATRVSGARQRKSAAPEVCITGTEEPFPASWDSLPRTTASDNRAEPFKTMSRPFSTLAVHLRPEGWSSERANARPKRKREKIVRKKR